VGILSAIQGWLHNRSSAQKKIDAEDIAEVKKQVTDGIEKSTEIARQQRRTSIREIREAARATEIAEAALRILKQHEVNK
jgi:hypothetical protein